MKFTIEISDDQATEAVAAFAARDKWTATIQEPDGEGGFTEVANPVTAEQNLLNSTVQIWEIVIDDYRRGQAINAVPKSKLNTVKS